MPRILKLALIILGFLIAGAFGYWLGAQRAQKAYGEHFFSEAFSREYHEARHDLATLQLLAENKTSELFQVAQYRYYSRLMLAADAAAQSLNPNLAPMLKTQLDEAQAFQKSHPYQFPTEKEQNKWVSLISPPR
jgi:hypothetical protein